MPARSNLFIPAVPDPAGSLPLYCFPYAGGSPYVFMDWLAKLRPEVQVVALQMPGHGTRFSEPPHETVEAMVGEVVDYFPDQTEMPFAFYGHSLGAVIALEVARRLRQKGQELPCHLFVGGARPPHCGPVEPLLHALDEKAFLEGVQSRYSGIPQEVLREPELLAILLPALRGDFAAYETHSHEDGIPLDCPISAFAGEDDPLATAEVMNGWARYTNAAFDLKILRGDHFFLKPRGEEITAEIKACLKRRGAAADMIHHKENTTWQTDLNQLR